MNARVVCDPNGPSGRVVATIGPPSSVAHDDLEDMLVFGTIRINLAFAGPHNYDEYRALVNEAAVTAGELRLLTQSISGLVKDVAGVEGIEDTILDVQTELLDRFFLRMVGFLVLFFILLLVSRFVWVRMSASH